LQRGPLSVLQLEERLESAKVNSRLRDMSKFHK
jgi:hypothetical protein